MQPDERRGWRYRVWLLYWWIWAVAWLVALLLLYVDMAAAFLHLIGVLH